MIYFKQILGLIKKECRRYLRVPFQTIGAPVVSASLYFLIFGINLGAMLHSGFEDPYLVFLIPGIVAMNMVNTAFENSTSSLIGAKNVNELQDLRTSPLSKQQIIWAKSLASLSRGFCVALFTFIIGATFYYIQSGIILTIAHPFVLIFFLVAGTLTLAQLGIAIGMWATNFEHISRVSSFILTPFIYLGGVFFTPEHLSPIWQKISLFNPLFYIINGFRYGILANTEINLTASIIFTLTSLLACHLIALHTLKKGSNYSHH